MNKKRKIILEGLIIALTSLGNPRIAIIAYNALQGAKKEAQGDKEAVRDE